jgi:hypothetical protein
MKRLASTAMSAIDPSGHSLFGYLDRQPLIGGLE